MAFFFQNCLLASMILTRNQLLILLRIPCNQWFFFAFRILPLSFDIWLWFICGPHLFKFILLVVHWASQMCTTFFIKFGKFFAIIYSNILSASFSLSCHSDFILHTLVHLTVSPQVFEPLTIFPNSFFFLFFSLGSLNGHIFKLADFFLLPGQICCWTCLEDLFPFISVIVLFNTRICFFLFHKRNLFIDILYLVRYCSYTFLTFFRHGFL